MLKLKAYAKINLSLKVRARRPDGYHEIESVMQSISLCDRISLETIGSGIQLTTDNPQLPLNEENLAYRAAQAVLARTGQKPGVKIHLQKNIPLAAGLAGGSADAAAVLYGLNRLLGTNLPAEELMGLGETIGSDVPFCLAGGTALVRGRGEIVERQKKEGLSWYYVLVVPPVEVSTKWAYAAWDEKEKGAGYGDRGAGENDLEPMVIAKYPIIDVVKRKLLALGCSYARMSGSGACVFGEVAAPEEGKKMALALRREYPNSFLVEPVDRGVEVSD